MFYSVNIPENSLMFRTKCASECIAIQYRPQTHKTEKDRKVLGETLIILLYCTTLQNTKKDKLLNYQFTCINQIIHITGIYVAITPRSSTTKK